MKPDSTQPDQQIIDNTPVFPFYLDVEMMTAFIATLEDGISFSSDVLEQRSSSETKNKEGALKGGIGAAISPLVTLGMDGGLQFTEGMSGSREHKFVVQHTEASLFNRLRRRLYTDGLITIVDGETTEIPLLGSLVELDGVLAKSPLSTIIDTFNSLTGRMVYPSQPATNSKSGKPATTPPRGKRSVSDKSVIGDVGEDVIEIFDRLAEEEQHKTLTDVLITFDGKIVPRGIVTLRQSAVTRESTEHFEGNRCLVLGKVSNVFTGNARIPLYRRSLLNLLPEALVDGAFENLANNPDIKLELPSLYVSAPAIQVLPVAIYV